MPANDDLLYQLVGDRIRKRREQLEPKLSQAKLADRLGLTRASIVNIEAGRQRAPLHVLWKIAEVLDTELVLLLPSHDEYLDGGEPVKLDETMVRQIEEAANGNLVTKRKLTSFVRTHTSRSRAEADHNEPPAQP